MLDQRQYLFVGWRRGGSIVRANTDMSLPTKPASCLDSQTHHSMVFLLVVITLRFICKCSFNHSSCLFVPELVNIGICLLGCIALTK